MSQPRGGDAAQSKPGESPARPQGGEPAGNEPATTQLRDSASELPRRIPKSAKRQEAPPPSSPSDRPGWFETPSGQPRQPDLPQPPPGQIRPPALFGSPVPEPPPGGRSDFRDFGRPAAPGRGGGPVPHHPSDQHAPGANGVSPVGERPESGPNFDAFTAHRSPQPPGNQPWPAAGPQWPGMPEPPADPRQSPPPPPVTPPQQPAASGWPPAQDHGWPDPASRTDPQADAPWAGMVPKADPQWPDADAHAVTQWPGIEPVGDAQRPGAQWPGSESPSDGQRSAAQWPGSESPGDGQRPGAQWPGSESKAEPPAAQWPGAEPQGETRRAGGQWPGAESKADAPWPGAESRPDAQLRGAGSPPGAQWPGAESSGDHPWPGAEARPGQDSRSESRQEGSGLTAPGSAWSTPSEGTAWPPSAEEARAASEAPGPHGHVPRGSERWRAPSEGNRPPQGPWSPSAPQSSLNGSGPEGTAVLGQPPAGGGGEPWQAQSGWQQNSGPWQGTTQPGWAQPPGPPRKNRWLWPLVAAVVVLVVAGGTFVFFQTTGGETPQAAPPRTGASPGATGAAPAVPNGDPKSTDFDVCAMLDPEQTERLVPAAKIDMRMNDNRDDSLVSYVRWTCEWTNRNISYGEVNRQRQITVNVARYEAIGDTTADKAATIQYDGQKRQWDYTASVSNDERYYSKPQVYSGIGDAAIAQYQWTRDDDYRYAFGTGFGRVGNITFEVKYEASQQHKEADVLTNDTKQSITEPNALREIKGLLTQLAQSAGAWYAGKPLPFAGKARPSAAPSATPSPVKIALPPNCVAMNATAATLVPNTEGLAQSLTQGKAKVTECQWWNDAMPVEGGKVRWRNLRIGIREFPNAEMARFYLVDERGKSRGTAGSKIGGIQWGKVQKLPGMGTDNYGQAVKQQTETAYSGAYEIKVMQDKYVVTVLFGGADRPAGTEINNTGAVLMPLTEAAAGAKAMATGLLGTL
ncbi:hypothetical protein [Herbidospora cretacea]|uniref:hypothetical protein n=1 Tax=Herbidospora cretacea TaxID=28444 RepID=UPI0012F761F4|nr:hypothetical protein [Herbidospora cretacea]